MNGYVISLPIRALTHNVPAQLFLNCTDDELQPHTRKLALPLSLHPFIIDRDSGLSPYGQQTVSTKT
jgi:hypothetical protein